MTENSKSILAVRPLGPPPWPTLDPFLFCVHHLDIYPEANESMGPNAPLTGRNIGMDFEGIDGWRMYHGDVIPGFPQHPHRGFETVTLARRGLIDHSDSLGATARFGGGDVQWMTAGKGIVHSEMFPLLDRGAQNPAELFQIWLNLPREDKMVDPYFTMMWANNIPSHDHAGTKIVTVAGQLRGQTPPAPPPNSWAARARADVAIWTVQMRPGAELEIPPAQSAETNRTLYWFAGERISIFDTELTDHSLAVVAADRPCMLRNGDTASELLMLQGRPIGQPVVQYGPFVMNTEGEIKQAMMDYQRTQFGGWPWPKNDPVHDRDAGRFAIHADGRRDEPSV